MNLKKLNESLGKLKQSLNEKKNDDEYDPKESKKNQVRGKKVTKLLNQIELLMREISSYHQEIEDWEEMKVEDFIHYMNRTYW